MTAVAVPAEGVRVRHREWDLVVRRAPQLALTSWRYLDQVALSMRPSSVDVADNTLRTFTRYLVTCDPGVKGFADVEREHIEDFKSWFARTPTVTGKPPARNTIRQRHGMLRTFFEGIIEWGWEDARERTPIFVIDVPVADDPLPRFLDDAQAARLMAAAAKADQLSHLVVELLARTGMRVGELCELEADAMVHMDGAWWLRVPVGKLHNDRYVPLHPNCFELLQAWISTHPPAPGGLLIIVEGRPIERHRVSRIVRGIARAAGLGHVHPHQLRHTLATQAINRGMRLEAIAAMLGHRSLHMTMVYARIANRTVPTSTQPRRPRSTPSMRTTCRPTSASSRASIAGCSATAGAPGRPTPTAPSRRSAKAVATSRPPSSSGLGSRPSVTMPKPMVSRSARTSTSVCSPPSTAPRRRARDPSEPIGWACPA